MANLDDGTYEVGIQSLVGFDTFFYVTSEKLSNSPPDNFFRAYDGIKGPRPFVNVNGNEKITIWVKVVPQKNLMKDDRERLSSLNQYLSCNVYGVPGVNVTDGLSFKSSSVQVDVGINRYFGGNPISFKLRPAGSEKYLDIIDKISSTGSAWQTAIIVDNGNRKTAYNQAAGNRTMMWGYYNRYWIGPVVGLQQKDWNPIFSDQHNALETPTSPCYGNSSILGDGRWSFRPQIKSDGSSDISTVVQLTNSFSLRPSQNISFNKQFDVDQSIYMKGMAAKQGNLQVYFYNSRSGKRVGPVDPWSLSKIQTGEGLKQRKLIFNNTFDSDKDIYWISTVPIDYALLEWTIEGKKIYMGLRNTSKLNKADKTFTGQLSLHRYSWCANRSDPNCYNIQWHSNLERLQPGSSKALTKGQISEYNLQVTVGSAVQLRRLGFEAP